MNNAFIKQLVDTYTDCYDGAVYIPENHTIMKNFTSRQVYLDCVNLVRSKHKDNPVYAAYEIKSMFNRSNIPSLTVVLKRRTPGMFTPIRIHDEYTRTIKSFSHHTIEIFYSAPRNAFYVCDILYRSKAIELKHYISDLCKINECDTSGLRYDLGYLYSMNFTADNTYMFPEMVTYLDKVCKLGGSQVNMIISYEGDNFILSEDCVINPKYYDEGKYTNSFKNNWIMLYNNITYQRAIIMNAIIHCEDETRV